jgi:uncharacterized protein (TIGR01777 family)
MSFTQPDHTTILVSGATGFIGRALLPRLLRDGHRVVALTRHPDNARLPPEVVTVDAANTRALVDAMARAGVVVNLAGESVASGRWSERRKRELRGSRIDMTKRLLDAARESRAPLRAFVSASAVGYYGDRGDRELDETAAPADDFLARLCVDWENEARGAGELGARVAVMRLAIVLGHGGGALHKIVQLFRAGIGGKLGDGKQWFPWVHLQDAVEALARAAVDDRYRGPFNVVSPGTVTNATFATTLGHVLHRPSVVSTPRLALKLALGEAASSVLASQRVRPARLTELGFAFAFPDLEAALRQATHAHA